MARLNARAGIARAGATRAGDFWSKPIFVTLNSVNVTTRVDLSSVTLTDDIHQAPNMLTFAIRNTTTSYGQTVDLAFGSAEQYLFRGKVIRWSIRRRARQTEDYWIDVTAADWTWDLDARLVCHAFDTATSATDVVSQLMWNWSYPWTFDPRYVETGLDTITMRFTFEPLSECLNRIANAVGADWYLDVNRNLHFFVTAESGRTPEALSASSIYEWRDLSYTNDGTQLRTRVYCEGMGSRLLLYRSTPGRAYVYPDGVGDKGITHSAIPPPTTDPYVYIEDAQPFLDLATGINLDQRVKIGPGLYVIGGGITNVYDWTHITTVTSTVAVGATTIPVADSTGIDLGPGAVVKIGDQLIRYDSATVTSLDDVVASGEGSVLQAIASGADVIRPPRIDLNYGLAYDAMTGEDVTRVEIQNDATAQSSYGVREYYFSDRRLDGTGAAARALTELTLSKAPRETITYRTRDPQVRSGATVAVSLTNPTLSGTFTIQRVTTTFSPYEKGPDQLPLRQVEASNVQWDFYSLLRRIEQGKVGA